MANVTAYTLAGGVASASVGATLGWLGEAVMPEQLDGFGIVIAIAVAAIAIARELDWLTIPLPQATRQTQSIWGKSFPSVLASILWGFDLGLVFTTWLTFSGIWLLAVVAFVSGEPVFGVALFTMHWLGRALSVWVVPLVVRDGTTIPQLLDGIADQHRLFRRIHATGLVWAVVVLVTWLTSETLKPI